MIRILWASHVVHHSSQRFNLSTALRQPWTNLTTWVFYLPLILAGVHPAVAFHEYASIARDLRAAVSWRHRAGYLFRAPGWQPAPGVVRAAGPARPGGRTSSAPG